VQYASNKFITSREFDCRIKNKVFDGLEYKIKSDNAPIFLTDSSWDAQEMFELIRNNKDIYVIIYDLIPILNPDIVFDFQKKHLVEWIHYVLKFSSKCLCISQSVANDLISYYRQIGFVREKPLEIYTIHLGFDIPELNGGVRDDLRNFVGQAMTFLTVGTVEPRKNHLLLLNSVKQVLKKNPERKIQLLILGRDGWLNDDFKRVYESDDMIKDNILWVKDASDDEVQWAYRNCAALVYPTKNEGFGLPLVEAARFSLPIICSDIPIIHEIVGDNADYFTVDDIESLSDALVRWIDSDIHPDSSKVKMYTWKECAMEVVGILNKRAKPYAVLS
jgi:glycosyltransferase involved in cell wall biosynthesis